jgi:predicted glycosyl hydrolase (DUF1957 family)
MILNYKNFLNENVQPSGTTTTPVPAVQQTTETPQPAQATTVNSNGGGTQVTTAQPSGTTQTQTVQPQATGTTQVQVTGTTQAQATGTTQTETSDEILDPEVIKTRMKTHIDNFIRKAKEKLSKSAPTPVPAT